MKEGMSRFLIQKVDGSNLEPVDGSLISVNLAQAPGAAEILKRSGVSLRALDLLQLNKSEIFKLSKKFVNLFKRTSWKNGLEIEKGNLEIFDESPNNGLLHEIDHLRKIQELRPGLIDENTPVNILAAKRMGKIFVMLNVQINPPEVRYTAFEMAQIMMAPVTPSDQDYMGLLEHINHFGISKNEISIVLDLVRSKPESLGQARIIHYLD